MAYESLSRSFCIQKSGARAIAVNPQMKNTNIQKSMVLERAGAVANSFHMKTPQQAEIIVAPCPMEYDTAGPTICARDATKFRTAPVHQIMPPTMPHTCHRAGADVYPEIATGLLPSRGCRISKVFAMSEHAATPKAKNNDVA